MPIDVKSDSKTVSVRIYETPDKRRPSWTVAFRFQGKRLRKRFASIEAAKAHAKEQANNIAHGKTAAINLSSSELASCARALEISKRVGKPIELIAAEYAEIAELLGKIPPITAAREYQRRNAVGVVKAVGETVLEFLATKKDRQGDYKRLMEGRMKRFAEVFQCSLDGVTAPAVEAWIAGLDVSLRTQRNYMADVRALFRFAIKKRYLPPGFDELESIELPESGPGKIQPYSPEEMRQIFNYAQEHAPKFLPYLPIRAFSGIRYQEMMRLRPEHFHRSGWISMDAEITKTHHRRLVPILPVLKAWLKRYPVKNDLIPSAHGSLAPRLVEVISKAGVTPRRNGLRDSFVSYRMAVIRDAGKVAEETGHSVEVMRRSYREIRMLDGRVITPAEGRKWFNLSPL